MWTRLPAIYSQLNSGTRTVNTGISQFGFPRASVVVMKEAPLVYIRQSLGINPISPEVNRYYNGGIYYDELLLYFANVGLTWYTFEYIREYPNYFTEQESLIGALIGEWSHIMSLIFDASTYPPNYVIPESNLIENHIALLCSIVQTFQLNISYSKLCPAAFVDVSSTEVSNTYGMLMEGEPLVLSAAKVGNFRPSIGAYFLASSPIGGEVTLEADPLETITCSIGVPSLLAIDTLVVKHALAPGIIAQERHYFGLAIGYYCALDFTRLHYSTFGLALVYCPLDINPLSLIDALYVLTYCALDVTPLSFIDLAPELTYCALDVTPLSFIDLAPELTYCALDITTFIYTEPV